MLRFLRTVFLWLTIILGCTWRNSRWHFFHSLSPGLSSGRSTHRYTPLSINIFTIVQLTNESLWMASSSTDCAKKKLVEFILKVGNCLDIPHALPCIDYSIIFFITASYNRMNANHAIRWLSFLESFLLSQAVQWHFSSSFTFRWMLRLDKKANHCRRLGLGMVACHRRSKALPRGDDTQSHVRDGRDSTRRRPHRHRSRTSQNHEGDFLIKAVNL